VEAIAATIREKGRCRGADLAKLFGVSNVTVTKTVARLQSEGLVNTEPYGPLRLSVDGEKLAEKARKRHETVFLFLLKLGVRRSVAETDSEGIEHHVSEETLRAFRRFLKNDAKSAHGA
jgi:DtxR family manganese transport transcriptional regulator